MKILQIGTNLTPAIGGPYQVVLNVAKRLTNSVDLELWSFGTPANLSDVPQETIFPTLMSNRYGICFPRMTSIQRRKLKDVDAVIHHGFFTFPLLLVLLFRKKRTIVMPHGCLEPYDLSRRSNLKKFFIQLVRSLSESEVEFWVASESELVNVKSIFPRTPVYSVGLGIDLNEIQGYVPAQKGKSKQYTELIFLGRVAQKKNVDLIIKSLDLNGMDKFNLRIIGEGNPKLLQTLKKLVSDLGLVDRVNFAGMTTGEQKYRILSESDIFILPSKNENFAVAVAESIACLTPVIVSKEVALSHFVSRYGCGIVIERNEPQFISQAVFDITKSYEHFVENCLENRSRISWEIVIERWKGKLLD
jgi:glycosyltransferase involved in cell wall biosynthesis